MAYADRKMSSNRIYALVIVALVHALLGYAFVTGLAYKVIKNAEKDLNVFDVAEEPPPPEEEPPPPPPDQPEAQPPPMVVQRPIVQMPPRPSEFQTQREIPPPAPPVYTAAPAPPAPIVAPPPPPPPPPPVTIQPARARANLKTLVSNDDYPAAAQRNEEAGSVGFRLEVGPNGRVTSCSVTSSSGSSSLDTTTCRLMTSRARFTPATNSSGQPTTDTVTNSIRWVLQDE